MYQFRLSTLLLAFVVVWSALAVFGSVGGIVMAVLLLAVAACFRGAKSKTPAVYQVVFIVLGFGLLGFLLQAYPVARGNAERIDCLNNLRQIGLSMRNYEAAWGRFPPAAVTDYQGKAMHSWRMLILPYMDQSVLYSSYDMNEPWDGPKNSKLTDTYRCVFCCWSDRSIQGRPMTSYLAVTGPGTIWGQPRSAAMPLRVVAIEVAESNIPWMEPRDLTLDEACRSLGGTGPRSSPRHAISGGFFFQDEPVVNVLFSDASVRPIPAGLPPKTVRGLFTGDLSGTGIRLVPDWSTPEDPDQDPHHKPTPPNVRDESPVIAGHRRIHWANCTALAVLMFSYAVMLFRRGNRRAAPVPPTESFPPAAAGGKEGGTEFLGQHTQPSP